MVQLREKDLAGGKLLELAKALKQSVGDSTLLLINERVDVASVCGVSGVQLGEEAIPTAAAREILGSEALIGRSVHSEAAAVQAARDGSDFLIVGTMFASRSHPGEEPSGPALVRRIASCCDLPLIGIGGIRVENVADVLHAGATGVAVISSIMVSSHPRDAARRMKQAMLACYDDTSTTAVTGGSDPE